MKRRAKYTPARDWSAEVAAFNKDFEKESDRGCVLLAASLLEVYVEQVLVNRLVPAVKELENNDPIVALTFARKIELAYRMGAITELVYRNLRAIKEIRNTFAHYPRKCAFDDPDVAETVRNIRQAVVLAHRSDPPYKSLRQEFSTSAAILLVELALIRDERKHPQVRTHHFISMPSTTAPSAGRFKF